MKIKGSLITDLQLVFMETYDKLIKAANFLIVNNYLCKELILAA